MSAKVTIKNGQSGLGLEACVKKVDNDENALCTNISGITGQVRITTIPAAGGGQTDAKLSENGLGVNFDAAVNGTLGSPIDFYFYPFSDYDFVITDIIIAGLDGGIKLNYWLGKNSALSNGCELSIKSDDETTTFDAFKSTMDLSIFSTIAGFELLVEASQDLAKAIRQFIPALVIRKQGTFGVSASDDDYIRWRVQDSHAGVNEVRIEVRGFKVDPGVV